MDERDIKERERAYRGRVYQRVCIQRKKIFSRKSTWMKEISKREHIEEEENIQ